MATINGKANIVSHLDFAAKYPNGKIPRQNRAYGKTFICRRGCNQRTATYTDEFVWEDVYHGPQDIETLQNLVQTQTIQTRKRKTTEKPSMPSQDADYAVKDQDPETPRKKRKLTSAATTPTSRQKQRKTPSKLLTPAHRRIMTKKPLGFTPLGTRMLPESMAAASPHQRARSTLHVSAVPHALPCREVEFETVYSHLEAAISDGTGSCIYISGTPGTGKTATVREVVAALHDAVADEELDDFVFVEINGMKVTNPHQSYAILWEALKGQRLSPAHAHELLDREFNTPSPRRVPVVVLMDELDQLVTRNQDVMYDFFNWPQLRHSRLIVLAVANTMDLPERTLNNKISSRLGLTRITFPGYTHQQLITIIESRLEGVEQVIVEKDAVQFASRKVAAVSGDARRALDVCRRAVEIAEQELLDAEKQQCNTAIDDSQPQSVVDVDVVMHDVENIPPGTPSKTLAPTIHKQPLAAQTLMADKKGIVTIATIKRAINEATSTPLAAFLRSLSLPSKVFLSALLINLRRTGTSETILGDVLDTARRRGQANQSVLVDEYMLAPRTEIESARLEKRRTWDAKAVHKVARLNGLSGAAVELAEAGVIGLETRRGQRVGRVRLGVTEEEVRGALRDDDDCVGLGFAG